MEHQGFLGLKVLWLLEISNPIPDSVDQFVLKTLELDFTVDMLVAVREPG